MYGKEIKNFGHIWWVMTVIGIRYTVVVIAIDNCNPCLIFLLRRMKIKLMLYYSEYYG